MTRHRRKTRRATSWTTVLTTVRTKAQPVLRLVVWAVRLVMLIAALTEHRDDE